MGSLWNLQSKLLVAIQSNNISSADHLLCRGVDADVRFQVGSQTRPAICLCVERGHLEMAELLLKWGCSINQYDLSGLTPLHIAASHGHVKMVKLLLKNHANVTALTQYGHTALHLAAQQSCLEIVEMLAEAGSEIDRQDQDGRTSLSLACMQGCAPIVRFLINCGADVNIPDSCGNTPLLHATSIPLNHHLISLLIKHGAKMNDLNKQGETPLINAIKGCRNMFGEYTDETSVIELLIDAGCDLDYSTPLGQSPLHLAVLQNLDQIVKKLVLGGSNPNTCDVIGLTPIFHLAKSGKAELVKLLVAAGGDMHKQHWLKDKYLLAEISNEELKQWLLQKSQECPKLNDLCRTAIRSFLGQNANKLIVQLPLPSTILNFLQFEL